MLRNAAALRACVECFVFVLVWCAAPQLYRIVAWRCEAEAPRVGFVEVVVVVVVARRLLVSISCMGECVLSVIQPRLGSIIAIYALLYYILINKHSAKYTAS